MIRQQTSRMHGVIVSVSKCRVSPDLSGCRVYLSVFPSEKGEEMVKNVNDNQKQVRYELGKRTRFQLRIIPELKFFLDDSLDYAEHIDELLGNSSLPKSDEQEQQTSERKPDND